MKNNEELTKIVIDRANGMLKDETILKVYNTFKTEDEAKDWLIKSAIATLIIPVEDRTVENL